MCLNADLLLAVVDLDLFTGVLLYRTMEEFSMQSFLCLSSPRLSSDSITTHGAAFRDN